MDRTAGSDRRWQRLAIAMAVVPFIVSMVKLLRDLGNPYYLTTDWANIEMRTRDVGRHEVLFGLYSRAGWSHPGPALFDVLALPYRLTGSSSVGLFIGALLISAAATVGAALVARRLGGTSLLVCTMIGWGLAVHALGPDLVRDPWVCYVTVLPFGLLILLSWAMTCRKWWALPASVAVASFLIQTHVQYLALAGPLVAWGAMWLGADLLLRWRDRRAPDERWLTGVTRPLLLAGVILVVLWLPPVVIDPVLHSPSNLHRSATYLSTTDDTGHTISEGYRVVAEPLGLNGRWLSGVKLTNRYGGTVDLLPSPGPPWLLILGTAATVLVWRRRNRDGLKLMATVAVTVAIGVVTIAETIGPAYQYRTRWTWTIAGVAVAALLWAVWLSLGDRGQNATRRGLVPAAFLMLGVITVVNAVDAARPASRRTFADFRSLEPGAHDSQALKSTMPAIVDAVSDRRGEVLVTTHPLSDPSAQSFAIGLVLQMEKRGLPGRFDSDPVQRFGNHRTLHGRPGTVLTVAVNESYDSISAHPGQLRLVTYHGDHTRPVRARIVRQRRKRLAELDAQRKAGRIDDNELAHLVLRAPNPGDAVAVYERAPGSKP